MRLAQPHPACEIVHAGQYVRADVGSGSAEETHECYRTIATLVLQQKYERALVVGLAHDDPINHLAARDIVIALHVVGVAAGFKLALVPRTEPTLNGFKHAESEGRLRGMRVQIFDTEAEAVRWLTEPDKH
jgi:hypothetical protein